MRLIDADELIKNIPNEEMISKYAVAHAPTIDKFEIAKVSLKEAIDSAETIGDVIEKFIIADRPQGEWTEREVFRNDDNNTSNPIIDDWQSAKCSVCGKYHTTPYLYYFDVFNYCPHCGARMKGADDE